MNKKQKVIIGIALAVFAFTLMAAPWTVTRPPAPFSVDKSVSYYTATSPVWDAPNNGQLNIGALLIEWVAVGVLSGGLVVLFRQKH